MKSLGVIAGYGGVALAVYALVGINAQPTLGNTAMLGVGCVLALLGFLKIA